MHLNCFLLVLVLLLFGKFSLAESVDSTSIEDLIKSIETKFHKQTDCIDSVNNLAWKWRYENMDDALSLLDYCTEESNKINYRKGILQGLQVKSLILNKQFKIFEAKRLSKKGIELATKWNDQERLSSFYSEYSAIFREINIDSALFYAQEALKLNRKLKNADGITANLNNIALLYQNIGEYETALEYFQQILDIAEEIDFKEAIAGTHNNMASAYSHLGNKQKALIYYKRSLAVKREIGDSYGAGGTLNNIGLLYARMSLHEKADEYFKEALAEFENIRVPTKIIMVLTNMSFNRNQEEEFETGLMHALKAEEMLNNDGVKIGNIMLKALYEQLYHSYKGIGNVGKALEAHEKFIEAKDYQSSEDYKNELSKNQAIFEVSLREKEIKLLKSENELGVQTITHKNEVQRLLIVSVCLVVIVALLLLLGYQAKKRSESLLTEKNALLNRTVKEKEVLLDEVHHRVKNNLQMITAFLEMLQMDSEDESLREVLQQSIGRIQAMGLIHKATIENDEIQTISSAQYISNLLSKIKESQITRESVVEFRQNVENFPLSSTQATSLGLIINELVTNSFKYAFTPTQSGIVDIELNCHKDEIELLVSDNGIGFPEDVVKGTGMNLVEAFVAKMKGEIERTNQNGTNYRISLPLVA